MRRTVAWGALFVLAGSVVPGFAARAAVAQAGGVTISGDAVGETVDGGLLTVTAEAIDPAGWEDVREIAVELRLRGRSLDRLVVDPAQAVVAIAGEGAAQIAGTEGVIEGAFFVVDVSRVVIAAGGQRVRVTATIRFAADPSPGSRLVLTAAGPPGVPVRTVLLRRIPEPRGGVSVGTLVAAALLALLVGAIVGSAITVRRRRRHGPSVYAAVARRIAERPAGDGAGGASR